MQKLPPSPAVATTGTTDSGFEADAIGPAIVQESDSEGGEDVESLIEVDVGIPVVSSTLNSILIL